MDKNINVKKIAIFIAITFFLCIIIALLLNHFKLDFSDRITAFVVAFIYMPTPAISAFITQKIIYKSSLKKIGLTFYKKQIKNYLPIFLIFISIILLTTFTIYVIGNTAMIKNFGKIDFTDKFFHNNLSDMLNEKGIDKEKSSIIINLISNIDPSVLYVIILLQGTFLGGFFNIPFMFGEEFGWRGFLLFETKGLGFWNSSLLIGFIWGIWHLPLILLGLNYPDHPYIGILMMIAFTISLSPLFSYTRLKTKSLLGSCLLHGMFNGTAGIFAYFVNNGTDIASSLPGFAGILSIIIVTIIVFYFDENFTKKFLEHFDN